ncbi:uncharacterized protein LOC113548999 [Rhopalosiphum maidis]|uniref:uncharacterized protein LOC113548999 n=1 Tax=Rhopalosiphum maidis TaxID=43146 RepID=UPI000EFE65B0|nr:uncharacterized protein LOC113548999 [Rhopalosiphum maidis]XP_060834668.1 uncharacterized protein LOC132917785 [Rhopalosiphum padi]
MHRLSVFCCAAAALSLFAAAQATETALEFGGKLLDDCGTDWTCAKPKLLKFIGQTAEKDELRLTRDLSLKRTHDGNDEDQVANSIPNGEEYKKAVDSNSALRMLDRIDDFLSTHELRVSLPEELGSSVGQVKMPLVDQGHSSVAQQGRSRGFVRKIVIPFLLGLKFKTTVLIPIAIALIALKTWKALTLGLLSLVLSAAMVIYRFTKPKVVGVEILHYPSPVHAHHHDGYAHARAYSAQQPEQ